MGQQGRPQQGRPGNPNGQLAGPTAAEPFTVLRGLAVDSNGHLWIDAKHPALSEMFEFEQAGTYTGQLDRGSGALRCRRERQRRTVCRRREPGCPKVHRERRPCGYGGRRRRRRFVPVPEPEFHGSRGGRCDGVLYLDQETTIDAVPGSCPSLNSSTGLPRYCEVTESFGAPELTGGAGLAVDPNGAVVYAANTTADTVDQYVEAPPSRPRWRAIPSAKSRRRVRCLVGKSIRTRSAPKKAQAWSGRRTGHQILF